ncbi:MAG: hypothetical protein J0H68_05110 [Sphingobacteriia bacterium]|nr:hypothetical protein [Sphingobacteriia bacterium]
MLHATRDRIRNNDPTLTNLNFRNYSFEDIKIILSGFNNDTNTHLISINFTSNDDFNSEAVRSSLIENIFNKDRGIFNIVDTLNKTTNNVQKLNLTSCKLGESYGEKSSNGLSFVFGAINFFSEKIMNGSIRQPLNYIEDKVTFGLSTKIRKFTTKILKPYSGNSLSDRFIGQADIFKLAELIKDNKQITELILANNSINDNGAEAIGKALATNTTLVTLDLSGNCISFEGLKSILYGLKYNNTLRHLNLHSNWLGTMNILIAGVDVAEFIVQFLKENKSLVSIDLRNNNFNKRAQKIMAKGILANKDTNRNLLEVQISYEEPLQQAFPDLHAFIEENNRISLNILTRINQNVSHPNFCLSGLSQDDLKEFLVNLNIRYKSVIELYNKTPHLYPFFQRNIEFLKNKADSRLIENKLTFGLNRNEGLYATNPVTNDKISLPFEINEIISWYAKEEEKRKQRDKRSFFIDL